MSGCLIDLISYDSDSETPLPTIRATHSSPAPRVVANSPTPESEYPPVGVGDAHPARLSLFPRIQMISGAPESSDAASTKACRSPDRIHALATSHLGQESTAQLHHTPSTNPVASEPSIRQPSPRVSRVEKMRALRPERKIRVHRTESSSVISAASSDSSRTSSPISRRPAERSISPSRSSSPSAFSEEAATPLASHETSQAPGLYALASSYHYSPEMSSYNTSASVHPRFRRYVPTPQSIYTNARDLYTGDGGENSRQFRDHTPDSVSSPETTYPSLSMASWETQRTVSSSERCPSPLSELSSTPPRTPSPARGGNEQERIRTYLSESEDGEDELADDTDDSIQAGPSRQFHRTTLEQSVPSQFLSSDAVLEPDSQVYAQCRWDGCGELFPRNFGPARKSYAPFNQMHHRVMDHYRIVHDLDFVTPRKLPCLWEGCTKEMTGKSFSRHLLDAHMHLEAHRCERCGVSFSRRDAVTRHLRKCDGSLASRTVVPGGKPRVDKSGSPWVQPSAIVRTDAAGRSARQHVRPAAIDPGPLAEEPLAQVVAKCHQDRSLSIYD